MTLRAAALAALLAGAAALALLPAGPCRAQDAAKAPAAPRPGRPAAGAKAAAPASAAQQAAELAARVEALQHARDEDKAELDLLKQTYEGSQDLLVVALAAVGGIFGLLIALGFREFRPLWKAHKVDAAARADLRGDVEALRRRVEDRLALAARDSESFVRGLTEQAKGMKLLSLADRMGWALNDGDHARVQELASALLQADPGNASALLALALNSLAQGHFAEAEARYDALVASGGASQSETDALAGRLRQAQVREEARTAPRNMDAARPEKAGKAAKAGRPVKKAGAALRSGAAPKATSAAKSGKAAPARTAVAVSKAAALTGVKAAPGVKATPGSKAGKPAKPGKGKASRPKTPAPSPRTPPQP